MLCLGDVYMKRLQINLDEELDERLAVEAAKRKSSKAALIREAVAAHLGGRSTTDPLDSLVGAYDEEPGSIDELIYGRAR